MSGLVDLEAVLKATGHRFLVVTFDGRLAIVERKFVQSFDAARLTVPDWYAEKIAADLAADQDRTAAEAMRRRGNRPRSAAVLATPSPLFHPQAAAPCLHAHFAEPNDDA